MIELKKKQIESVLILIDGAMTRTVKVDGKEVTETIPVGLTSQRVSLGVKRRLHKIFKAVMAEKEQYEKDKKEILDSEISEEEKKKEMDILQNEVVKLDVEKVKMELIDSIETDINYDFSALELICEE